MVRAARAGVAVQSVYRQNGPGEDCAVGNYYSA